ncbi:polysaccharide deacetylase family protein [Paenibacillus sp. MMS18-CY102]|uniref:polysaccharide deacetylase family protein n=1 Tax=Paenibacillus sp. MMS18-CY102 TaxID=2682849 RepID=UPI001365DA00|nr:polysaccharide deacetylase family protein [Paenibacillus sp. MMS18-CY102]MWC28435.1 polysaccharide deacetylase family protein [Paenibacillus sp. MMS18-CY102]
MNRMLKAAIPLSLAVALSACGTAAKPEDNQSGKSPAATEQPATKPATPTTSEPVTPATPADPTAPGKNTEEQAKPAVEQPAILYKMNKVYRFVPIDKQKTTDKAVLLTFDDGPKDLEQLTSMLDTLEKHKAKAIFFVNGYRVKQHPELLKLIHERGQTIGNHSWDHIDLKKESKEKVEQQVGDVSAKVKELTGEAPKFFRPPFGSGNDAVKAIVKNGGMLYMTWSNGSLDWDSSTKDKPDKVIANVLEQLHPGANILMHELPWTAKALDELLTKLEGKGYGFIDPATIDTGLKS